MKFLGISVQPSYGKSDAIIRWTVDAELESAEADYYVFRSPDGAGDWERANSTAVEDAFEYLDVGFHYSSRIKVPHYRVMAVLPDGSPVHSHTVGLFDSLRRSEYGACHYITRQEYRQIRQSGIPVLHYIPKTRGEIAPNWDEELGKITGPCDTPGKESYGQKYVGGYRDPFYTHILYTDTGPVVKMDREDGLGILDGDKVQARMLSFPRPEKGHLIVHPETDNRYMVTDVVKPYKFRGIYPVAFMTQLELLRREDPAYSVPTPDLSEVAVP
jgi:hypothetical protein